MNLQEYQSRYLFINAEFIVLACGLLAREFICCAEIRRFQAHFKHSDMRMLPVGHCPLDGVGLQGRGIQGDRGPWLPKRQYFLYRTTVLALLT